METIYKTFDEIKEPRLRRTIEGLAKLYFNGDVNVALSQFNNIEQIMGCVYVNNSQDQPMGANLQFAKR